MFEQSIVHFSLSNYKRKQPKIHLPAPLDHIDTPHIVSYVHRQGCAEAPVTAPTVVERQSAATTTRSTKRHITCQPVSCGGVGRWILN